MFQNGKAVFMRNWPYAWSLGNGKDSKIAGKIGVAALPKGGKDGKNSATLGGWQLAVSKYSKHPQVAADLVMYLTSAEVQKRRAIQGSLTTPRSKACTRTRRCSPPTPFMGVLYDTFEQRGGAPVHGDRPEVQPGQQRVLERHPRRAGRQAQRPEAAGALESSRPACGSWCGDRRW